MGGGLVSSSTFPPSTPWESKDTFTRDSDRKARLALETAETHFIACERAEAERWFREAIRQAPRSTFAATASDRLKAIRAAAQSAQSAEPPLADEGTEVVALQLRVLHEAARQYREAIQAGDPIRIDACAKSLDTALKATKQ
jgi:hypothetical protein